MPSHACCPGLKTVHACNLNPPNGWMCPISLKYCLDCGNGKCDSDSYENWWNCPEDCKK